MCIDYIYEFASDEFENPFDWLKLAKSSEAELKIECRNIKTYYTENYLLSEMPKGIFDLDKILCK